MEKKLDVWTTLRIGMAFLSICAFWQMYNNVIPLILTNTFHLNETWSGVIMAADNVLALFLLPLFGGISDRFSSKLGRRRPFILVGTIAAVVLMMLLPLLDDSYFAGPAAWKLTAFVVILALLLISMGSYRSPAVALMPDVTPKPLRSRANALINLMGAIGGILYLIIASVLYSQARTAHLTHVSYLLLFAVVAGIMILALIILMKTVDEPKLFAEQQEYERMHPEDELAKADTDGTLRLPKEVKRSLGFLLASIALYVLFIWNANDVTDYISSLVFDLSIVVAVYVATDPSLTLGARRRLFAIYIFAGLSMFFFDVRLKHYVEIRMADSMPIEYSIAYAALIKGLFYDDDNLLALEQALPAETSYPAASSLSSRDSESQPSTMMLTMPGRRPSSTVAEVVGTMPVPGAQSRS